MAFIGRPRLSLVLFAVLAFVLTACISTVEPPHPSHLKVSIANFAFVPQDLSIAPGDSVTWSNDDGSPHAVTFSENPGDAKTLFPGETYTRVFNAPGSYGYFCSFHTFMTGRITVRTP